MPLSKNEREEDALAVCNAREEDAEFERAREIAEEEDGEGTLGAARGSAPYNRLWNLFIVEPEVDISPNRKVPCNGNAFGHENPRLHWQSEGEQTVYGGSDERQARAVDAANAGSVRGPPIKRRCRHLPKKVCVGG
jgi:hypothetical protein